jgi:hypothetical protein
MSVRTAESAEHAETRACTGPRALRGPLGFLALATALTGCASRSTSEPSPSVVAAAVPSAVVSVDPWVYAERPGQKIRTRHFIIYTTELAPLIRERVPLFLETSLGHYRAALATLGDALPEPGQGTLDTYILDNRADWERLTRQLLGPSAGPYLEIGYGGYAFGSRAVLFDIGAASTLAVAAHEGWHQYTQATFAQPLPIWLEEGVATYMEGHRWSGPIGPGGPTAVFLPWANLERFDQLRDAAAANRLMPLQMLLEEAPQSLVGRVDDAALTYYAQLWAMVHFLAEGDAGAHRPALERALADAANGRMADTLSTSFGPRAARSAMLTRRGSAVFYAYFGDPKALETSYRAFIAKVVGVGSRGPVSRGESPLTASP